MTATIVRHNGGSLRAERSNLLPAAHCDGNCRVATLLTLNRAAVGFSVIPVQAGSQGEHT